MGKEVQAQNHKAGDSVFQPSVTDQSQASEKFRQDLKLFHLDEALSKKDQAEVNKAVKDVLSQDKYFHKLNDQLHKDGLLPDLSIVGVAKKGDKNMLIFANNQSQSNDKAYTIDEKTGKIDQVFAVKRDVTGKQYFVAEKGDRKSENKPDEVPKDLNKTSPADGVTVLSDKDPDGKDRVRNIQKANGETVNMSYDADGKTVQSATICNKDGSVKEKFVKNGQVYDHFVTQKQDGQDVLVKADSKCGSVAARSDGAFVATNAGNDFQRVQLANGGLVEQTNVNGTWCPKRVIDSAGNQRIFDFDEKGLKRVELRSTGDVQINQSFVRDDYNQSTYRREGDYSGTRYQIAVGPNGSVRVTEIPVMASPEMAPVTMYS